MSIKLVSHENDNAKFDVVVKYEEFEKAIKDTYKKTAKDFNIPGFRKGKAPRKIIEANYGKQVFYPEALDVVMPEAYVRGVEELKLDPIGRPEVDFQDIEEGKDIVFTFVVETKPVPEIGDYSVIELEEAKAHLEEKDVDDYIENERQKNKVVKNVEDREVKEGDVAVIDFEGFKEDVAFEGGKGEDYELKIGSNTFIPGFEEQLVGKKPGEEVEVNVTFPEDYHAEELKGAPVLFKVVVKSIKEEILPELDDEFAVDVSEFDTLEEYRNDVREKLQKDLDEKNRVALENQVLEKLVEMNDIKAPESMVEERLEQEVHEYGHNLDHMGLNLESFYRATQSTEEDLKNEFRPKAELSVKVQLLLDALVEKENVEVTEEEVGQEYLDIAKQYNQEGNEEFMKQIKASISDDYVKEVISKRKVVNKLVDNVKFVEKSEETEEDKEQE
ncbi:MAG: trigger factor [Tissierellia bacterium]|nr:trigger factor [Tissierellia bacterium]